MTHLANTAGALLFPESRQSMTRIGLGLYGLHPCADTRGLVELRPAMRIVTHVSHVQRLEPGSRPSYGRIRPLVGSATVATAPIGYADGFPRRLSRTGVALIGETPFPLAGMVTMDQIVIDVGDAEVAPGDEVVVLGTDGEASFTADDWARALDTISYEVVCGIGPRVPRRYVS
jgi:alanine racemase